MAHWQQTGNGSVFLNYGPMQLWIYAQRSSQPSSRMAGKGAETAKKLFTELCQLLDVSRKNISEVQGVSGYPKILETMIHAAEQTRLSDATPMIAVAGSIAELTAEKLKKLGATKAIVNNGGDIALVLGRGQTVRVGVMSNMSSGKVDFIGEISSNSKIRGVATSGLGGRSFTLGIASSAVAFGKSAALADACATALGNATALEDFRIHRKPAELLNPDTDIPGLQVVTYVEPLPKILVEQALEQAGYLARQYIKAGSLEGAMITVQGKHLMIPSGIVQPMKDKEGVSI